MQVGDPYSSAAAVGITEDEQNGTLKMITQGASEQRRVTAIVIISYSVVPSTVSVSLPPVVPSVGGFTTLAPNRRREEVVTPHSPPAGYRSPTR